MMKNILSFICFVLIAGSANAQPNDTIVQWLNKKKHLNFESYIFIPTELMKVCEDSTGQNLFNNNLTRYLTNTSLDPYEYKEKQILVTIVYNAVKRLPTSTKSEMAAQNLITSSLKPFLVDFKIDLDLLTNRFTWTERRAETCDIGQSLYIFFCYDPELYLKACQNHKTLQKQNVPFPFSCTLENVNLPRALREKMRVGILNRLQGYNESKLVNIAIAVKNFSVDDF